MQGSVSKQISPVVEHGSRSPVDGRVKPPFYSHYPWLHCERPVALRVVVVEVMRSSGRRGHEVVEVGVGVVIVEVVVLGLLVPIAGAAEAEGKVMTAGLAAAT